MNKDAVRRFLLPMLPLWPECDPDSREAIDWFVDAGYFFVQAMKWTLTPHAKRSYVNLATPEKRLAIDHAVNAHLLGEIELIRPRAIIALGNGAWDACLLFAELYGQPRLDERQPRTARLRHHLLHPSSRPEIPLHVTYLPGIRNERNGLIPVIHGDVGVFLQCINGGSDCEAAERQVITSRMRKPSVSNAEFQDFKRSLKAIRLWPIPTGMTNEELAKEFVRRTAMRGEGREFPRQLRGPQES